MPQETLEYSSLVSNAWASTIEKVEDDDNVYAIADTVGQMASIELGDMTSNDIGTINHITFYVKAFNTPAKRITRLVIYFQDSSGTTLNEADITIDGNIENTYNTGNVTGTSGGSAWTESSINDLRILFRYYADVNGGGTTEMNIDYAYLVVDYDVPVVPTPTYNSNRNQLHIANGRIDLTSGRLSI